MAKPARFKTATARAATVNNESALERIAAETNELLRSVPSSPKVIEMSDLEKLTIKDIHGKLHLFKLNGPQRRILKRINDNILAGRPIRKLLLKARKWGGSTFFCAVFHHLCKTYGLDFAVLGHKESATLTLYEIIYRMFTRDPDMKSTIGKPRKNKALLEYPSGGTIQFLTAGGPDAATSMTLHGILATEQALWCRENKVKAGDQMRSLLNCVSDLAMFTFVILETTARNKTDFQERWNQAKEGKNAFDPIFMGVFDIDEYTLPFGSAEEEQRFIATLSAEEKLWMLPKSEGGAGATLGQVNYSRWLKANKCRGTSPEAKEADFNTEYPWNDIVAFQFSNRSVFDQAWCRKKLDRESPAFRKPPIWVGNVKYDVMVTNYSENPIWKQRLTLNELKMHLLSEDAIGAMQIWEWPDMKKQYVMGQDIAEGIEVDERKSDESAITVREIVTGYVVATWRGKVTTRDFAFVIATVGRLYFTMEHAPYTVPENNSIGTGTLERLWDVYPTGDIHQETRGQNPAYQIRTGRLGDRTAQPNKIPQIEALATALNDGVFDTDDEQLIIEMQECQRDKLGRIKTGGMDIFMAAVKSEVARNSAPRHVYKEEVQSGFEDRKKRFFKQQHETEALARFMRRVAVA